MMRIKLGFLHTVRDHVTTPLTLSGNEDVLVLSKQPGFRRWATDEMVLADGGLRNALDRETLHQQHRTPALSQSDMVSEYRIGGCSGPARRGSAAVSAISASSCRYEAADDLSPFRLIARPSVAAVQPLRAEA